MKCTYVAFQGTRNNILQKRSLSQLVYVFFDASWAAQVNVSDAWQL